MPAPIAPEIKAAALADVLAGMSVNAAAKKHGVSRQGIVNWQLEAGVIAPVLQPEESSRVGAALERYMCAVLDALTDQVAKTRQVDWLAKHGVDGFAKLHRTLTEGVAGVVAAQEIGAAEEEPTPIRRAG